MSDLMDADLPKPKDDEPKMYVLTNSRGMYGASFVADKQVLGTIADRWEVILQSCHLRFMN